MKTIQIHKREPSANETREIFAELDPAEVARVWVDYAAMAPFVAVNPDPGDESLPAINPKGFAECLSLAYGGWRGFEVQFIGDVVHVTPPVMRQSLVKIGVSIRKVSE
jgi:hypothetical protein